MALKIPVTDNAYSNQEITLAGIKYNFKFKFNERDSRWRLSIYIGDTPVILGVKIMENEALLGRYRLTEFAHGDLLVLRAQDDGEESGRDNFGIGKAYELIYIDNDEITEILDS